MFFSQILWSNIKVTHGKLPAANQSKAQKLINNTVYFRYGYMNFQSFQMCSIVR